MSRNSQNKSTWSVTSNHPEREPYNRNDSKGGDKYVEASNRFELRQGSDDGDKPTNQPAGLEMDLWTDWSENAPNVGKNWKTGALPHVGKDSACRYGPSGDFGTGSPAAASPTGRYAKPGGKGQRSGA